MKIFIHVVLFVLISCSTQAQESESTQNLQQINIKGSYKSDVSPNEVLYLSQLTGGQKKVYKIIDSVVLTNKYFSMSPLGIEPGKYLLTNMKKEKLKLYLDYGTTEITVDTLFSTAAVTENLTDSLIKRFDGINLLVSMTQLGYAFKASKYEKEGKAIPEEEKEAFAKNFKEIQTIQKNLARELGSRPDMVGAYVLTNGGQTEFTTQEMNKIYEQMPILVKNAPYGVDLKNYLDKINSIEVGVMAPDFLQQSLAGEDVRLREFMQGKKLVLIDFWASWCAPCRKENPHVVALYSDYKQKGFDIIGVSLDSKKDAWMKAVENDKLTWTQVSDLQGWDNAVARLYNVKAVPHTVLIDGNGRIVAKNLRGEELRAKVAEICD